jgi:Spy/CpxP family protein refolding chaperone
LTDAVIERLRNAVNELQLSEEQQAQIRQILEDARARARELAQDVAQSAPPQRRQQLREFAESVQQKVRQTLTDEQAQALQQKLREAGAAVRDRVGAAADAAAPTTQDLAPRVGRLLERIRDAVDQLDLTEEQKAKVRELFAKARSELAALRQQAQQDAAATRQKLDATMQTLRQDVLRMLSPEQQERLRDLLSAPQQRDQMAPPPEQRPDGARGQRRGQQRNGDQPMMMDPMMAPLPPASQPTARIDPSPPDVPGVQVGQAAPDFTLSKLDGGGSVQLSSLKGKIVLLVFGAYSSPSFRQRNIALEEIRRQYGTRITPLVIYTREPHPVGQWEVERNKDEGIAVEQPADLDTRTSMAKQAKTQLKLSVPIVIDTMEDSTARDYGGFTNAAILIGRDGTVLHRQKWFEPYSMRRAIDEAVAGK